MIKYQSQGVSPSTPRISGSPYTFLDWRRVTDYGFVNPVVDPMPGSVTPFQTCLNLCQAGNYGIAAWSRNFALQINKDCLCGNEPVPETTLATETSGFDEGAYELHSTGSSFSFAQCGSQEGAGISISPPEFYTLKHCFDWCGHSSFAAFSFAHSTCGCTSNLLTGPSLCSTVGADYQYFSHSADATASGLSRRKRNLALDKASNDPNWKLCPAGTSACLVGGGKEGYECLSVEEELESCGGCLEGKSAVGATNATVGRDCSTIPGVPLGGVSCHKGNCEVSSCKSGWELREGGCVAVKRRSR